MTTNPTTRRAGDTPRVVDTHWDVDGCEYRVVTLDDSPQMHDAVRLLRDVLDCTELEAEHAYRVIREDGEFITSVQGDIEDLPLFAA